MGRTKEREEILHVPSTMEIFNSLSSMPEYSAVLLKYSSKCQYAGFLRWLIEIDYFSEPSEKISVKYLAIKYGQNPSKVKKWITDIYDDILNLNKSNPEYFIKPGIKIILNFRYNDNHGYFETYFPVVPRVYENIAFPFMKAKLGWMHFWVKKIEYEIIDSEISIFAYLEGGILNRYREYALEKAEFQERIHWREIDMKYNVELDEMLRRIYRK